MKKNLLFLLFFSPYAALASGKFVLSPEIIRSYESVFSLQINAGVEHLKKDAEKHEGNPFHYLIDNYIDLIKCLIEDDPAYYRQAVNRRGQRIENLKLAEKNSPFYYYCLAEVHLQWAMIRLKNGELVLAGNDLRKTAAYLGENQLKYPDFILNNKIAGVLHSLAGAVPPSYVWLARLAGIDGTHALGISELARLETWLTNQPQFSFLGPEVLFLKSFISINFQGGDVKPPAANEFGMDNSNQPLLIFLSIIQSQKAHNSAMVLALLDRLSQLKKDVAFCYLDYLKGEASLNLYYSESDEFQSFLNCTKGQTYRKAALRKKAWSVLLKGDEKHYKTIVALIPYTGNLLADDDKQADLEARSGIVPDILLLKARLSFDAGEYEKSFKVLHSYPVANKSINRQTEFYYRLGRNFQCTGDEESALENYNKAIKTGRQLNDYFAASAAFYSGDIYQRQNRKDKAVEYYKMVYGFKMHPYKNSLDAKARAALKNLGVNS